jgi:hypothetical protein
MQFTKPFKTAISEGRVTLTFRNWKRVQAKVGGRYNIAPFGAIEVTAVTSTCLADTPPSDIEHSGFTNVQALQDTLGVGANDTIYRVAFHYLGSKHVNQPEQHPVSAKDLVALRARLQRMDKPQPWTLQTLSLLARHPGVRAGDLAKQCGKATLTFKRDVRKLKVLGLTISLETGYRLSSRGEQVLRSYNPSSTEP